MGSGLQQALCEVGGALRVRGDLKSDGKSVLLEFQSCWLRVQDLRFTGLRLRVSSLEFFGLGRRVAGLSSEPNTPYFGNVPQFRIQPPHNVKGLIRN